MKLKIWESHLSSSLCLASVVFGQFLGSKRCCKAGPCRPFLALHPSFSHSSAQAKPGLFSFLQLPFVSVQHAIFPWSWKGKKKKTENTIKKQCYYVINIIRRTFKQPKSFLPFPTAPLFSLVSSFLFLALVVPPFTFPQCFLHIFQRIQTFLQPAVFLRLFLFNYALPLFRFFFFFFCAALHVPWSHLSAWLGA